VTPSAVSGFAGPGRGGPKMPANREYGCYSREGDLAVDALVDEICALPETYDEDQLFVHMRRGLEKVCEIHAEAFDTTVRESILFGIFERSKGRLNLTTEDIIVYYSVEELEELDIVVPEGHAIAHRRYLEEL
jgi:hypothetical protein